MVYAFASMFFCSGGVRDAFDNQWWFGTHIEDVPEEEMAKRAAAQRG